MKRISLLIGSFILIHSLVCTGQVITIEECEQLAIAQSSANTQKELNEQLLHVKLNDVSSHLYPTLEINGGIAYLSQRPELPTSLTHFDPARHDVYNISLNFQQVVFDGLQAKYSRQREKLLNKNEISKLDLSISQIKENVIALYLNLLIIDKQMSILSSVESTYESQVKRLMALFQAGVVYGNTIDQLELEGLKIQQQKDELQASRESLIASLSILTGKDLTQATFVQPDLLDIEYNTESERYEFSIFKNQNESLEYQRKLHFSKSLPKVWIFANGGYGNLTYNLLDDRFRWFYAVGLQFKIPIIDWAKTKGVSDIITLQKSILASQEADFKKANEIAIQEKINEIKRIEHLLVLDEQIIKKYQDIKETASTQLLNGTISALDFIKQQNDELQSIIGKEVHKIQLLKTKYELLALKGRL